MHREPLCSFRITFSKAQPNVYFMMLYIFFLPILSSSFRPTFWCHFRFSLKIVRFWNFDRFLPALHKIYNIEILGICHFFRFTIFVEQFHEISNFMCSFALFQRAFNIMRSFFFLSLLLYVANECVYLSMCFSFSVGCLYFIHICLVVDVNKKKNTHIFH